MYFQVLVSEYVNDNRVEKTTESLTSKGVAMGILCLGRTSIVYKHDFNYPVKRIYLKTQQWPKVFFIQAIKFLELIIKMCLFLKNEGASVLHCNDLGGLIVGSTYKAFFNSSVTLIYDSHEFQSETHGLNKTQKMLRKWVEKNIIKNASAVITVSESIANSYKSRYKIPKPVVIFNAPLYNSTDGSTILKNQFQIEEQEILFIYQGMISQARGVDKIANAFIATKNKFAHVVFMGDGPLAQDIKEIAENNSNIHYHPPVLKEKLIEYSSSADFGIHLIPNTCLNHDYCMPNKLFEYINSTLPVIVSNVNDMAKFVVNNNVGFVVDENNFDLDLLLENIKQTEISSFKANCKSLALVYNWENEEKKLFTLYKSLDLL